MDWKLIGLSVVIVVVGVPLALLGIKWGFENDVPVLKDAAEVLDR